MFIKPHSIIHSMKVKPQYSYEFNCILNKEFNEMEQIKNFASLLSDKDRFLALLPEIENNTKQLESILGFNLPEEVEVYIVRAELFKSFSLPITIEYSLCPEEMIVFLLKELIKSNLNIRFPDEQIREQYVNSAVDAIAINGDWSVDLVKFGKNLHDESQRLYPEYELKDINFSKKPLTQHIEELFDEQ